MTVYLKRMIYSKRYMLPLHYKYIYKERKSRGDENGDEPGYYEVPEEIRLCLRALIQSESGEKEEHSYHGITCGNEDIKTGPYKVLREPGSTCPLRAVVEHYDDGTKTQKAFRMVERHKLFIPAFLLTELYTPEQEKCQSNIHDNYHN